MFSAANAQEADLATLTVDNLGDVVKCFILLLIIGWATQSFIAQSIEEGIRRTKRREQDNE